MSALETCPRCHQAFPPHELVASAEGRICDPCNLEREGAPSATTSWKRHPLTLTAAIATLLPMVFSFAKGGYRWHDGVLTEFWYRDWAAVTGGAVALAAGLGMPFAFRAKKFPRDRSMLAIALAVLALGGWHVAKGFGAGATRPVPGEGSGGASFQGATVEEFRY